MDLGLSGKTAIIVGGARGIGYAIAEVLAREGCDLAISARGEDSVKDAVAELRKYGTKVVGGAARAPLCSVSVHPRVRARACVCVHVRVV